MKALLLAALIVSPAAQAVEVKCPDVYPAKTLKLAPDASDTEGHGLMKRAHLSYTYIHDGELYSEQTLVPPPRTKVKGGWHTEFGVVPDTDNWLVCVYGGATWGDGSLERWQRLDSKLSSCVLHVKQTRLKHNPQLWNAWAVCK
ncbi:hypothetical protein INH39_29960 [Massilia violaceinigra]|uniref:Uncharacterized protein n=1 Tax=Massilia violaceinigra TaxID=2045208 RepID=A0ABY4A489_9BURK|nr:STY0301 family protein [Massilia violaceinigra]UOD29567.1 hypothetical protein INH39_29960 [Massilia violaceinigra]